MQAIGSQIVPMQIRVHARMAVEIVGETSSASGCYSLCSIALTASTEAKSQAENCEWLLLL